MAMVGMGTTQCSGGKLAWEWGGSGVGVSIGVWKYVPHVSNINIDMSKASVALTSRGRSSKHALSSVMLVVRFCENKDDNDNASSSCSIYIAEASN